MVTNNVNPNYPGYGNTRSQNIEVGTFLANSGEVLRRVACYEIRTVRDYVAIPTTNLLH